MYSNGWFYLHGNDSIITVSLLTNNYSATPLYMQGCYTVALIKEAQSAIEDQTSHDLLSRHTGPEKSIKCRNSTEKLGVSLISLLHGLFIVKMAKKKTRMPCCEPIRWDIS